MIILLQNYVNQWCNVAYLCTLRVCVCVSVKEEVGCDCPNNQTAALMTMSYVTSLHSTMTSVSHVTSTLYPHCASGCMTSSVRQWHVTISCMMTSRVIL